MIHKTNALKHKFSLVIVVLGALYLGATWWFGKQIEAKYFEEENWQFAQQIQESFSQADPIFSFEVKPMSIQRGFFSSNATFKLTVYEPSKQELLTAHISQKISHGPLPAARFFKLKWLPVAFQSHIIFDRLVPLNWTDDTSTQESLASLAQRFSTTLTLGLNGHVTIQTKSQPIDHQLENFYLQASPIESNITFSQTRNVNKASSKGTFDIQYDQLQVKIFESDPDKFLVAFNLKDYKQQVEIKPQQDTSFIFYRQSLGDFLIDLSGLAQTPTTFGFQNSEITLTQSVTSDAPDLPLDASLKVSLDRFLYNQLPLVQFGADIEAKQIDFKVLKDILTHDAYDFSSLNKLLEHQPELAIHQLFLDNAFSSKQGGKFSIQGSVKPNNPNATSAESYGVYLKTTLDSAFLHHLIETVRQIPWVQENEAELSLDTLAPSLDALVSAGLFVEENNQYILEIEYALNEEDPLKLNAHPIQIEEILFLIMLTLGHM